MIAYVFSGANASGKSTIIAYLLEKELIKGIYVNADLILKTLNLEETKENYIRAFRIEAKKINKLIKQKKDLILEIVTSINIVKKLKKAGYFIFYVFIGTNSPKINSIYLTQRVIENGHDVMIKDLIRRWETSLINLEEIKNIVDCLILIDNSDFLSYPKIVKSYYKGKLCYINNKLDFSSIKWTSKEKLINIKNEEMLLLCENLKEHLTNFKQILNKNYQEKNLILKKAYDEKNI